MNEFLSVKQAATLLGINPKTIHALLAQGLKHQRLGRVIRIKRDDLENYGKVG